MSAEQASTSPGILAIFNNVAPGREAEFEHWFQTEHLAERIAIPGFLLARRYEALAGQLRYFNYYLAQSAAVLKSDAYLRRLDNPTPMTRIVMSEIFKDMNRTVCHRAFRLGVIRGAAAVAVRFQERGEEAYARWLHATILSVRGDCSQAAGRMFVDAAELAAELGMKPLLAHCHLGLGDLDLSRAVPPERSARRERGLRLLETLGMRRWINLSRSRTATALVPSGI